MPAPVDGGHITQEYGVPGSYAAGVHTGRDWAGGTGAILATHAGTVRFAGWAGDYGLRVEVMTDAGIQCSYSHMASSVVVAGQRVDEGEYLGVMGNTGNSRGAHCHYEERTDPWGYYDHREPQYDVAVTTPEPEPEPPEEDDDMAKPWLVDDGFGNMWFTDLATYKTWCPNGAVAEESIALGSAVLLVEGNLGPAWGQLLDRLPRIDK